MAEYEIDEVISDSKLFVLRVETHQSGAKSFVVDYSVAPKGMSITNLSDIERLQVAGLLTRTLEQVLFMTQGHLRHKEMGFSDD